MYVDRAMVIAINKDIEIECNRGTIAVRVECAGQIVRPVRVKTIQGELHARVGIGDRMKWVLVNRVVY